MRDRLRRVELLNRVLLPLALSVDEWEGTAYVLRTRTGESVLCADLATLFVEAERLAGRRLDPLDADLLGALEPDMTKTPITLITGFLGSGKTTLLRELLADPALGETAVLVNELGEIALDHHLLSRIDERTVVLASGCVCCTIRADLADELRDLEARRARGEIPGYARVAIETTGLADPAPILSTLLTRSDGRGPVPHRRRRHDSRRRQRHRAAARSARGREAGRGCRSPADHEDRSRRAGAARRAGSRGWRGSIPQLGRSRSGTGAWPRAR